MKSQAEKLLPEVEKALIGTNLKVKILPVLSQIGSGSLPIERLPSMAIAVEGGDKASEKHVTRLEKLLRSSDTPVIGRFQEKALLFDLRCLQGHQETTFVNIFTSAASRISGKA